MSEVAVVGDSFSLYKKYLPFLSAYFIFISCLYLWGFWYSFNVNIFQYIDISGIVKTAGVPLLLFGIGLSLIFSLSYIVAPKQSNILVPTRSFASGFKYFDQKIQFLEFNAKKILIIWIVGTVFIWFFPFAWNWDFIPLLIAVPVANFLTRKNVASDIIKDNAIRDIVVAFLVLFVPLSFSLGMKEAKKIKDGVSFTYIVSMDSGKYIDFSQAIEKKLRYISQINEYSFFYDPQMDVVSVSKLKPGDQISFKYYVDPKSRLERIRSNWKDFFGRFN